MSILQSTQTKATTKRLRKQLASGASESDWSQQPKAASVRSVFFSKYAQS